MTPKFSIIIPVYNVAPYLRECLDSVLAQTYTDWEAICVDDGSTDGSGAILNEYAARDSRFKVIHQVNAGVSAARNAALKVARGDWICFLDADDLWSNDALADMQAVITEYPCSEMVKFGYSKFDGGAPFVKAKESGHKSLCLDIRSTVPDEEMDTYMWQFAIRRDVSQGVLFRPYIGGEDRLYVAMCMVKACYLTKTKAVLYGYRQREGSAVHAPMSFRKLDSEVGYMLEMVDVCRRAPKRMSFLSVGWANSFLCKKVIVCAVALPWKEGRKIWWRWYKALPVLCIQKEIRIRDRLRLLICLLIPLYSIAIFFCYAIPRFVEGGSIVNWTRRKLHV